MKKYTIIFFICILFVGLIVSIWAEPRQPRQSGIYKPTMEKLFYNYDNGEPLTAADISEQDRELLLSLTPLFAQIDQSLFYSKFIIADERILAGSSKASRAYSMHLSVLDYFDMEIPTISTNLAKNLSGEVELLQELGSLSYSIIMLIENAAETDISVSEGLIPYLAKIEKFHLTGLERAIYALSLQDIAANPEWTQIVRGRDELMSFTFLSEWKERKRDFQLQNKGNWNDGTMPGYGRGFDRDPQDEYWSKQRTRDQYYDEDNPRRGDGIWEYRNDMDEGDMNSMEEYNDSYSYEEE